MWLRRPNWAETPKWKIQATSILTQYPGTSMELADKSLPIPKRRTLTYSNFTKELEFEMTSFFYSHFGRKQKFWQPSWDVSFKAYEDIQNGATQIKICTSNFYMVSQGYERFFMLLFNGDMISRQITEVTKQNEYEVLHLKTEMDRSIALDEIELMCLFLLGRFDMDALIFRHDTDTISSVAWEFIELIREYPE